MSALPTDGRAAGRAGRPSPTGLARLTSAVWSVPATADGLAALCCVAIVGLRFTTAVQMALGLPGSVEAATRPLVNLALVAVFVLESALVTRVFLVRRTPAIPWLCALDVTVMCLLLLGTLLYTDTTSGFSSWDAWAYGVSGSTVFLASVGTPRLRWALLAAVAMAVCYAVSSFPSALNQDRLGTALANTAGFLVYVVVIRIVWEYMKKVAVQSDMARAAAEREARRADAARVEADRLSFLAASRKDALIHTQSGMLAYLGQMEILAHDPEMSARLRQELMAMSRRGHSALGDDPTPEEAPPEPNLHAALTKVVSEFAGIDIVNNTHCARDVELPPEIAEAVAEAVRTLLWNVRQHAAATQVTVFAESLVEDPTRWVISVRDNGAGFDPASGHINNRFGLRRQVHQNLLRYGITTEVDSAPGHGTRVTISGDGNSPNRRTTHHDPGFP